MTTERVARNICPKYGTPYLENTEFCKNCGSRLHNPLLLENLKEVAKLVEEHEKGNVHSSQRTEFLQRVAAKILPCIRKWVPICLQSKETSEESYAGKSLYPSLNQKQTSSKEYAEKGVCLHMQQPFDCRVIGELCQIWLLRSGRFLLVKTKRYSGTDGYYGGYGDSIYYPPTWEWEGEALETVDDIELSRNLDKVVLGQAIIVRDLLMDLKEIDESQRGALLYILGVLVSKGVPVVILFENLPPRSMSVIGVDGLDLLSRDARFEDISSDALARFGKPTIKELMRLFDENEKRAPINRKIIEALGRIGEGEEVIEFLIRALKKGFDSAITALGDIGDERAYLPIVVLYGTPEKAAFLYTTKGAPLRIERARVLDTLTKQLTAKSVEPLIQALSDPTSEVNRWAIIGLGEIGDERAAEPLIQILFDDKRTWAHRDAAKALGKIGGQKAIDALKWIHKKHREKSIRDLADSVLKELKRR